MKKTQLIAILATVLLLASSSLCEDKVTTKKEFPTFNVVNGDMIKVGLSDYFTAEGGHLKYVPSDKKYVKIEGLAHKIGGADFQGNALKNCDHILTVPDTPFNKYIGLCEGGKSIYQIKIEEDGFDAEGYVKFKAPEVFKKKSDGTTVVKMDIPIKTGETNPDCYELQQVSIHPGHYFVSCKYESGKLLHFTFKVSTAGNKDEGLTFTHAGKDTVVVIPPIADTTKTMELDQVYNMNFSTDGKNAVAYDTFLN